MGSASRGNNMTQPMTLGQAIDAVLSVLEKLDDKSRETVLTAACSHLGMQSPYQANGLPQLPQVQFQQGEAPGPNGNATIVDIRTLKSQKQPRSQADGLPRRVLLAGSSS